MKRSFKSLAALACLATTAPYEGDDKYRCSVPIPVVEPLKGFPFHPLNAPDVPGSINILSMNIHNWGRSREEYPKDKPDCISKLAEKFALVAFQEDIVGGLPIENKRQTLSTDFNRSELKRNAVALPWSGLSFNTSFAFAPVARGAYSTCYGWAQNDSDCIINKGYQGIKIRNTDFYNTHLDAHKGLGDIKARRIQFNELGAGLPETGNLVLMADVNTSRKRPQDEIMLAQFLSQHNLKIVARSENGVDIIAVRGVKVNWVGTMKTKDDPRFSDHDPLIANISLSEPETKPPVLRYAQLRLPTPLQR